MDTKLDVTLVATSSLFVNPSNPRINDDAVPHVAASLKRFGFRQPIVAKRSGEVIAGNTRLKAALSLGIEQVPVTYFEGSDLDAAAYSIADNRTHEFSRWDETALAKILQELKAEDSLDGVGYSEGDLEQLLDTLQESIAPAEVDDQGPEAPPLQPVSRSGDLWILDHHRLLCGDSRRKEDVERVLGGARAALLATDPPYCVNYTGNDRPIHDGKPSGKDWSHLYNEVDIKDLGEFLDGVLAASLPHTEESAAIYLWHAHVQQGTIAAAFERHGLLLHQILVWVKPCATFGHCYYRWRHEPCAFGWKRGNRPSHGHGKLDTIWDLDWEGKQRVVDNEHPTQKPTRVFEIPMEQHTKVGDLVLEPFSGSGSQIIAAEKLGRRCAAIEIQPAFVDVAIRRWQKASGKSARLAEDGRTYDAIAAEGRGA